jgi:lysophospholipase L1-like esterase
MVMLAKANGISVVLGSQLPAKAFPWRKDMAPADQIRDFNRWLRDYAGREGVEYADYYSALADPDGGMRQGMSLDGVHPSLAGYRVMEAIARSSVRLALAKRMSPR